MKGRRYFWAPAAALLPLAFLGSPAGALDELRFEVSGDENGLERRLRGASTLVDAQDRDVTETVELLAAARSDYGRILDALYADGYYSGVVSITIDGREAAEIPPLEAPETIDRIVVRIEPGPVFAFGSLDIAPLAPRTELPDEFAPGEPAEAGVVRRATRSAVDAWREATYAKAEVVGQTVVARHPDRRLDADIDIAPGPPVIFGDIAFRGTDAVRERRLRQIAGFPSGRPFDPEEVEKVSRRLRATGVFASAALEEAETLGPGNSLDYTALLADRAPRRFGFGAELSSDEGLRLTGFWLHRNLLGGAERLRIDGEINGIGGDGGFEGDGAASGLDYRFGARFERPATFTTSTDLFLEAEVEREDEEDFVSNSVRVGGGFTKTFSDQLEGSVGLFYNLSDVNEDAGETIYQFVSLPVGLTYDTREDEFDPVQGVYLEGEIEPFLGFGETGSGARATADGRSYYGIGSEDRIVLAGRVQVGSILGADLLDVPPEDRFFSGGGGTVRGHAFESLGVMLPGDIDSGGASFFGVQAEARVGITERIGAVGFYDYGYVSEESTPLSEGEDHSGAGVGVRYQTPIGPLRVDLGVPVSGPSEADFQVYLGIGQAF